MSIFEDCDYDRRSHKMIAIWRIALWLLVITKMSYLWGLRSLIYEDCDCDSSPRKMIRILFLRIDHDHCPHKMHYLRGLRLAVLTKMSCSWAFIRSRSWSHSSLLGLWSIHKKVLYLSLYKDCDLWRIAIIVAIFTKGSIFVFCENCDHDRRPLW